MDDGSMGGTHWCCFIPKDYQSYYYHSFGGTPEKCLLNQLPKPLIYHNYKIQDIKSRKRGSYCLHFFYSIERMKNYDTSLKRYFDTIIVD